MTDQNQDQDEVQTDAGEAPQLDTTDTGDNSDTTGSAEGSDDSELPKDLLEKEVLDEASSTTNVEAGPEDWEPSAPELQSTQSSFQVTPADLEPADAPPTDTPAEPTEGADALPLDNVDAPSEADQDTDDEAPDEIEPEALDLDDISATVPSVIIVSRFITNVLKIAHPASAELEVTSKQLDAYRAHLGYVYSVPAHLAEASVQHLDILPKDVQEAICLGAIPDLTEEGN